MSTDYNKTIVRSYFERTINGRDLDWLEQIIGPEFGTQQTPRISETLGVPPPAGPALARHMVEHYLHSFPDIQFAVEDLLAEGDRVVVHVTFRGTHRGPFLGVPGTGRALNGSGAELATLKDGKIVAAGWQYHDELGLLRQMGALPAHG